MKRRNPKRQRGAALLALLAVIMLGASWFLVSRLNAETGSAAAIRKERNAQVLNRAKQALIGYVAAQAVKAGENRPGALPCPEAAASFNDPANEGEVSYPCTLPKVGRFPWKTLGLDKLVDASGEPLWYVVSPGWAGAGTVINSNSVGQLTVDGMANSAVALIIAPGPAFTVAAASGCAATTQVRPLTPTTDKWQNYLECGNATAPPVATTNFVTTGPSASFNDQVMRITVADIMPAIEAAIAQRIEREILPVLRTVYVPTTAEWGITGTNPILPFAAPFASPGPGTGTSNYHGASGTYAGLLPFNQMRNCTMSAADPRCTSTVLTYGKSTADVQTAGTGSIRTQSSCGWQSTVFVCLGEYLQPSISVTVSIRIANVAGGLRTISLPDSKVSFTAMNDTTGGWGTQTIPFTKTTALDSNGDLIVTITGGTLPDIATAGWGTYANYIVSINDDPGSPIFMDHALLDSTDATTGWFMRNEWYRLVYYAVSQGNTAARLPSERSCSAAGNCLSVANLTPSTSTSALLILGGRSINGRVRPSSALADYLEFGNANGAFERLTVTSTAATMLADTGTANSYAVAAASLSVGSVLQFTTTNPNTGASTLNTTATGTRGLINQDGTPLTAAAIQANAAVQVIWDGSVFRLAKRPFNDRVAVLAAN